MGFVFLYYKCYPVLVEYAEIPISVIGWSRASCFWALVLGLYLCIIIMLYVYREKYIHACVFTVSNGIKCNLFPWAILVDFPKENQLSHSNCAAELSY